MKSPYFALLFISSILFINDINADNGWTVLNCNYSNSNNNNKDVIVMQVAIPACNNIREFKQYDKNPPSIKNEQVCVRSYVSFNFNGHFTEPYSYVFDINYKNEEGITGSFRADS